MANITVDIQARVVGYQESIKQLQAALTKVDPGSAIGKKLTEAFEQAQSQVKALGKNMFPKASSDTQIDAIVEKVNRAGEAIQHVSTLLSTVGAGDLNLGVFGDQIKDIVNQISQLQSAIDTSMTGGIQSAIASSQQLQQVFAELGIDITKVTAESGKEALAAGFDAAKASADEARQAFDKAAQAVSAAEQKLKSIKNADVFGNNFDLNQAIDQFTALKAPTRTMDVQALENIKQQIEEKINKTDFTDKVNLQQKIDAIFSQINPSSTAAEFKAKWDELRKLITDEMGKDTVLNGFKNTDNIFNKIFQTDPAEVEKIRSNFLNVFNQFAGLFSQNASGTYAEKITRGGEAFEKAISDVIERIRSKYELYIKEVNKYSAIRDTNIIQRDAAQGVLTQAENKTQLYETAQTDFNRIVGDLQQQVQSQADKIRDLEAQIKQLTSGQLNKIKDAGQSAGNNAHQQMFPIDQANKYHDALERVKSGEQMLGKLQGVVQRWFSIYAVIRMVTNAIKKAGQNIQELDSTMTEIAIVTKMDQGDLWAQMPKYTKMARDYASSIKGVYEVSQIYYQQGLQMNEVMDLTESTLKMARISGLGYSEAADYMTNAVRSFKMEMSEASRVVDVYSAVAASSASNVQELATAMSKTASSAQAVGSSFENTTAMLAVMIEATRESPENIGSAMKSIISRYGELKENKTGIDEEGEAYSLNKVDTALQSVGISIHDVNGEFRDFDDVIFELAEHWNEIDKNTQRYIATIMAGNRQQSRFLALVSSSDRLKEEREKAENSEDASQLQFLKTLDSIDAKKQQLETNIQSIYTSSGIENVYKGLLDFANNVLITFDNLSSDSGLGMAITKIGATFTTLATLVVNVFKMIKAHMAITAAEITADARAAAANRLVVVEDEVIAEAEANNQRLENYVTAEEKMTAEHEAQAAKRTATTLKEEAKRQKFRMGLGMVASTIGLGLTTAAASLDVNKDREKKAKITGLGGILSGIGTGAMLGGPVGIIAGVITALPSVLEAAGMWVESYSEKISRLDDKITKGNNDRIKSKDELKTLEEYKKKYEELEASKDLSPESHNEWIKLNSEIVNTYPQLLSYIDEEGNSIAALGEKYDQLINKKRDAYEQSLLKDIQNHIEAYSDMDYVLKDLIQSTANIKTDKRLTLLSPIWERSSEAGQATFVEDYMSQIGVLMSQSQGDKKLFEKLFQESFGYSFEDVTHNWSGMQVTQDTDIITKALFGDSYTLSDDLFSALQSTLQVIETNFDYFTNTLSDYIDTTFSSLVSYYGNQYGLEYAQYGMLSTRANNFLNQQWEVELGLEENQNVPTQTVMYKFFKKIPDLLKGFNQSLIEDGTFLNEDTLKQAESIVSNTKKYSKNYLKSIQNSNSILNDFISDENWVDINETIEKQFNTIKKYYNNILNTAVNEGKIEKSDLAFYNDLFNDLFILLEDVPLDYSQKYVDQIKSIINSSSYLNTDKQSVLSTIIGLRNVITSSYDLTEDQKSFMDNAISETDFTTITGIQDLQEKLKDIGVTIDLSSLINNILPNIEIEMASLQDQLSSSLTDLEKALSKATKGMDFKDALELADSLDISLGDSSFSLVDGKYFYQDFEKLKNLYLLKAQDTFQLLSDKLNDQMTLASGNLDEEVGARKTLDYIAEELGELDLFKNDPYEYIFNKLGQEQEAAQQLATWYKQYYKDFKLQSDISSFSEFVVNKLKASQENLSSLTEDYVDYQINSSLIQTGQIEAFVANVGHQKSEYTSQAEENVSDLLKQKDKEIQALDELNASMNQAYEEKKQQLLQNDTDAFEASKKELESQLIDVSDPNAFRQEAISNLNLRPTSKNYYKEQLEQLLYNEEELNTAAQERLTQVWENEDEFFLNMAKQALLDEGRLSLEEWSSRSESERIGWQTYDESQLNAKKKELQEFARRPDIIDSVESPLNINYWKHWLQEQVGTEEGTNIEEVAAQAAWDAEVANAEDIKKEQERIIQEKEEHNKEIFAKLDALNLRTEEDVENEAKRQVEEEFGTSYSPEQLNAKREQLKQEREEIIAQEAQRLADEQNEAIIDAINTGETDGLDPKVQKQFGKIIRDTRKSISSSVMTGIFNAIEGGTAALEITATNQKYIQNLYTQHKDWFSGVNKIEDIAAGQEVHFSIDQILADESNLWSVIQSSYDNEKDRLEAFKNYHDKKYSKNKLTGLEGITDGEIAYGDFLDYLTTNRGWTTEQLFTGNRLASETKAYGLAMTASGDYVVENWSQYIAQLSDDLNYLLKNGITKSGQKATIQDINRARAAVQTAERGQQTAIKNAASDILDNYNDISIEQQEALANALGKDLDSEEIQQFFKEINGKTKLDIGKFKEYSTLFSDEIQAVLADQFSSIADELLGNIKDASSMTTSGTSSKADIQAFKAKAQELGMVISDSAFSYDSMLDAWTLDPQVLHTYVENQASQLVQAKMLTEQQALQYLNKNVTEVLFKNIDIQSFLEDENWNIADSKAQLLFRKQLKQAGLDESMISTIVSNLLEGGAASVATVSEIARLQGRELTSSEIETAYRSQISRIEEALEQITFGPGGIVSGYAVDILRTLAENNQANITLLDGGTSAVINSITDISAAYAEYYKQLAESGEATLAALNEAKAKILETQGGRYKEQAAIDALGDAAGMTYTSFAAILSDAGIKMTDDIVQEFTESLGGGKMRIKDFASFARAMKWDFDSEEYTSAFKSYNDALIERNKQVETSINEELKGLEDIKPGDWLNLTQTEKAIKKAGKDNSKEIARVTKALYRAQQGSGDQSAIQAMQNRINELQEEDILNQLNDALLQYGTTLSDGILRLSDDANLIGVAQTLQTAINTTGIEIADDIKDMIQNIMNVYSDLIIKGIEGSLTNIEKSDLKKKASDLGINLQDTDFVQGAEGFELSMNKSIALWAKWGRINTQQQKKIYKTLNQQLKDNNSNYKTSTKMLSHLINMQDELNELKDHETDKNQGQIEQLENEIKLLKEMQMYNLTHEDQSWNFMSNDAIPASIDNALNYFANWRTLQDSLSTWSQSGISDLDSFAAALMHVQEVADATGGNFTFMGKEITAGGDAYGDFLDNISKVRTWDDKNKKWGLSNEALFKELGFDMSLGGKGISKGLKDNVDEYVQQNADLLKQFDDFTGGLAEVYKTLHDYSEEGNGHSFEDFLIEAGTDNERFDYNKFKEQLGKREGALEAFKEFTDKISFTVGETSKSWDEVMGSSDTFEKGSDNYKAMMAVMKMALSENWDLESDYQAIADQLSQSGFNGEVTLGDITITAVDGATVIKKKKNGKDVFIDPDGNEHTTIEGAKDAINRKAVEQYQKELGQYSSPQDNTYEITIAGTTLVYTIEDGKIIVKQGEKEVAEGDSVSEVNENLQAGLATQGNTAAQTMTSEGWQAAISTQYQNTELYTGGQITSYAREKMQSAGLTTAQAIAAEYSAAIDRVVEKNSGANKTAANFMKTYGDAIQAEMYASTGLKVDVSAWDVDVTGQDELVKEVADQVNMTQTAVDVMDGITQAFTGASGQQISEVLSSAIAEAFTQKDIPISEIKVSPQLVSVDGETVEVAEIPTGTGIITNLKVTATTVEADGTISAAEITAELDGQTVSVKIDKQGAQGDIDAIKAAIKALSPQQVTVEIPEPSTDPITKAIDGLGIQTVNVKLNPIIGGIIGTLFGQAAGNIGFAHAKGTLMGELGPELVVSGGRYFVVGQSGPEMVNLADDAIVFNHLQTKSLLEKGTSSTRGRAITSEQKAVAYATGSIHGGPAHAGDNIVAFNDKYRGASGVWDDALNAVKDTKDSSDEAKKDLKAFIKELERWYNWLQRIAYLEKQINYEEALRTRLSSDFVPDGKAYYESQVQTLKLLQDQLSVQKDLNKEREKYLKQKRQELASDNNPFSALLTFDPSGQPVYKDKKFEEFSHLSGADRYDNPNFTAQQQYEYLTQTLGVSEKFFEYDKSGNKIDKTKDDWYVTAMQAYWEKEEKWLSDYQTNFDDWNDGLTKEQELSSSMNETLHEIEDNQISLENRVLEAIEDAAQREIDELKDQKEAVQEANQSLIDGLTRALDKERNMYETQDSERDLETKRRRLAILQRTGGSAAEIASLSQEIDNESRDLYFEKQQQQIDAIQEASDLQIEKLDAQIAIMEETLQYSKEHGLLWNQVYEIMAKTPEEITSFITTNNSALWAASPLASEQAVRNILFEAQQWKAFAEEGTNGGVLGLLTKISENTAPPEEEKEEEPQSAPEVTPAPETEATTGGGGGGASDIKEDNSSKQKQNGTIRDQYESEGPYTHAHLVIEDYGNGEYSVQSQTSEYHEFNTAGKCTKCGQQKGKAYNLKVGDQDLGSYNTREEAQVVLDKYIQENPNASYQRKLIKELDNVDEIINQAREQEKLEDDFYSQHGDNEFTSFSNQSPSQEVIDARKERAKELEMEDAQKNYDAIIVTDAETAKKKTEAAKKLEEAKTNLENFKKKVNTKEFGGMVDKTGMELVHAKEAVLTPKQASILRNDILGSSKNSLMNLLLDFRSAYEGLTSSAYNSIANSANNSTIIEHAEVNVHVDKLANSYDASRAGDDIMKEMLNIARKTSAQNRVGR